MIHKSSDVSFVCQFNFKYDYNGLGLLLIRSIEKLFCTNNFQIKKICLNSINGKIYRISHKKLNNLLDILNEEFRYINFRSDFNSSDFEPNTRFYAQIDNYKDLLKVFVVIKDQQLFDHIFDVYKELVEEFSRSGSFCFTGYSFYVPNYYCPVSLAFGILRRPKMPKDLVNLAHWYIESDVVNSTIGYLNCFSNLSDEQNKFLVNTFGSSSVFVVNNITVFRYDRAILKDEVSYFESAEYSEMCDRFEQELPFIRNKYDPFL